MIVVSGVATMWGVTKAQISHLQRSLQKILTRLTTLEGRVAAIESKEAVKTSQLKTISSILSPANLAAQSDAQATARERLGGLEETVRHLVAIHNSKHPTQSTD